MLCNEHIITLHMWISVAPSVGKINCSWIRYRMLPAVQDTSYLSWASTYRLLSGRHCYNTLSAWLVLQLFEKWDEELSAYKSSTVTIIIIMIIIKLEITYDFITSLYCFLILYNVSPKWLEEMIFLKIVPPVIFIILPHIHRRFSSHGFIIRRENRTQ